MGKEKEGRERGRRVGKEREEKGRMGIGGKEWKGREGGDRPHAHF